MRHDVSATRVRDDLTLQEGLMGFGTGSRSEREEKFRLRFLEVPQEEKFLEYYSCALSKDYYSQHGAIYITTNFICFRANIFGQERKLILPIEEVQQIIKVNTFRLIPSGIVVVTSNNKYTFESFRNRQIAYDTLRRVIKKRMKPAFVTRQNSLSQPGQVLLHKSHAHLFTKSQSSCSLDRKGRDDTSPTEENFLRPLSATVMHEYVVRRNSRAAIHSDNFFVTSSTPETPVSSDGQINQSAGTDSSSDCVSGQFSVSGDVIPISSARSPGTTIRITGRTLIMAVYLLCIALSVFALIGIKDLISSPSAPSSAHRTLLEDRNCRINELKMAALELSPLKDTFHLLNAIIKESETLISRLQRLLSVRCGVP